MSDPKKNAPKKTDQYFLFHPKDLQTTCGLCLENDQPKQLGSFLCGTIQKWTYTGKKSCRKFKTRLRIFKKSEAESLTI